MSEIIQINETARLKVVADEGPECPRDTWYMMTGFVKIAHRGDSRLMDVPAVWVDPIGIAEAHDRFDSVWDRSPEGLWDRTGAPDPEELVIRWARIFHDMHVEYDAEHGGYWFVDPEQLEENFSASPSGRRRQILDNPIAFASGWRFTARYYFSWGKSLEIQAQVIEQERKTYRQWANGEVYGVILQRAVTYATFEVTRTEDGFEMDDPGAAVLSDDWEQPDTDSSIWGCYLDDEYTPQVVALEHFDLTDEEKAALSA
jgi:hypothetical protein